MIHRAIIFLNWESDSRQNLTKENYPYRRDVLGSKSLRNTEEIWHFSR